MQQLCSELSSNYTLSDLKTLVRDLLTTSEKTALLLKPQLVEKIARKILLMRRDPEYCFDVLVRKEKRGRPLAVL